jgi:hypothetical protein
MADRLVPRVEGMVAEMTRREWLQKNPPPQPGGPLLERAEQLQAEGKAAEAATLRQQAAVAPAKCPQHPRLALHRHKNRIEDLFVCELGPHFLLWTSVAGRPQLVPLKNLDPPDIDGPMEP